MSYYAIRDGDGNLISIGKAFSSIPLQLEITKDEYDTILFEIREKAALVDKLYSGEITIADVPEAWQEEIHRRVDERIAAEGAAAEQDISAEEALDIILGGGGV